jgi:hypothetical protein
LALSAVAAAADAASAQLLYKESPVSDLAVARRAPGAGGDLSEEELALLRAGYEMVLFAGCPGQRAPDKTDVNAWAVGCEAQRRADDTGNDLIHSIKQTGEEFGDETYGSVFLYARRDVKALPLTDVMLLPFENSWVKPSNNIRGMMAGDGLRATGGLTKVSSSDTVFGRPWPADVLAQVGEQKGAWMQ